MVKYSYKDGLVGGGGGGGGQNLFWDIFNRPTIIASLDSLKYWHMSILKWVKNKLYPGVVNLQGCQKMTRFFICQYSWVVRVGVFLLDHDQNGLKKLLQLIRCIKYKCLHINCHLESIQIIFVLKYFLVFANSSSH